jgi:hypothetical protein
MILRLVSLLPGNIGKIQSRSEGFFLSAQTLRPRWFALLCVDFRTVMTYLFIAEASGNNIAAA